MLREAMSKGTEVGKVAKEYVNNGKLVPDEIVEGIILERLKREDVQKHGYLLDGFPRTASQADFLFEHGLAPHGVIYLNVPDEEVISRIAGRRSDPQTGATYHIKFNPAPKEIQDRLVIRSDDTEEKIKNRLISFHKEIDNILLKFKGLIKQVDNKGEMTIKEVTTLVLKSIEEIQNQK